MKPKTILFFLGAVCTLFCCTTTPTALSNLPELPQDYVQTLHLNHSAALLSNVPLDWDPPDPGEIDPPDQKVKKSSYCTFTYQVTVEYPLIVCREYSNVDPFGKPDAADKTVDQSEISCANQFNQHKLSALDGNRLNEPLICKMDCGPFIATIIEREPCDTDSTHLYTFELSQGIFLYGFAWRATALEPIPLPPQMVMTSQVQQTGWSCSCCDGYKACNQTCILNRAVCGTGESHGRVLQ